MLSIKGLIQLIFLFFSSITSSQSEHSLNLYSTQVTMWPFTGPDTEQADTFPPHRFRRQKDPSRFFLLCSFSTRTSSSCCLWGGRKPGSVPFMPFTPGASRRQLSRSEHLSAPPERKTQQMCARCVFSYPADELHGAGRSALCRRLSVHPPCALVSPVMGQSGLDATGAVYAPQSIQQNLARVGPPVAHCPGSVHIRSRFTLPQREFPPSEQESVTAVNSPEIFKW